MEDLDILSKFNTTFILLLYQSNSMKVIINGAGTVGIRAADLLASLHTTVPALVKYDAKKDAGDAYDIRTKEALLVSKRYGLPMFVAEGQDVEQRASRLKDAGFHFIGTAIDDVFRGALVIDAIDNKEQQKVALERYKRLNLSYNTNGGAKPKSADGRVWVSAPNSYAALNAAEYVEGNSMIGSCNTTATVTALALFEEAVGGSGMATNWIDHVHLDYLRRHDDPGKGKKGPQLIDVEIGSHHAEEVAMMVPSFKDRMTNARSKWPTEHFHLLQADFILNESKADIIYEKYLDVLKNYQRAIVVEGDQFSQTAVVSAASKIGLNDGDIPFPVYTLKQMGRRVLRVYGLTPQRGIVAPSTTDLVLLRTGAAKSWDEAFSKTNSEGKWNGVPLIDIKPKMEKGYQDALAEVGGSD